MFLGHAEAVAEVLTNTCRISFVCIMVLLLFTSHLALSSSARLRFIEAQDLVHGKQNNLLKLDEIEKADRTRLDYLFGVIMSTCFIRPLNI